MSVDLMGEVWKRDLDHPKQSVLLCMADHAHDDGTSCFPGVARIAWKTGYSVRQVQRIILDLLTDKILILVQEPFRGKPTEYRIDIHASRMKPEFAPEAFWQKKRATKVRKGGRGESPEQWGDKMSPHLKTGLEDKMSTHSDAPQPLGEDILTPPGGQDGVTFHKQWGDIPQPNGVTSEAQWGDKNPEWGDTAVTQEPSVEPPVEPSAVEPSRITTPPTPPRSRAGGNPDNFWSCILRELKDELDQLSLRGTQFAHLPYDYDAMFRDTWQARIEDGVLYVGSADPEAAAEGLRKYERRINQIAMRLFRLEMKFQAEAKAA